jgi:hypothetical protein
MTVLIPVREAVAPPKRRIPLAPETIDAIREGVRAVQEGRSRPWAEVKEELGL